MKILMLEPYYGGSHKAFIDGLSEASRHEWTVLTLPPYKWKWRMRHAAVTFAEQVTELVNSGQNWDLLFCSDMLNLAEFLGLAPRAVANLPSVAYFHENQLTYPARFESERDYQFVMTNMTSALAASAVWFNSAFHADSFLDALAKFLKRMPDFQSIHAVEKIKAKFAVHPPGIAEPPAIGETKLPPTILWAARWEHDKNPEDFFEAMKIVKAAGMDFRLSVIGEGFRDQPKVFDWAKDYFAENIDRWGYQQTASEYYKSLAEADIFVSTANHEFFGIGAVETVAAGAFPLLPIRLAYPEVFELDTEPAAGQFFYDGSVKALAQKLARLIELAQQGQLWTDETKTAVKCVERFKWKNLAPVIDKSLDQITR